jgi:RNA polymerase sigma factor (TIGR02999 family)
MKIMNDFSRALDGGESCEPQPAERLMPIVYEELRRLAAQRLASQAPGQTLQATALVHEAYLRLVGPDGASRWNDDRHFFAAAAEAMRHILVDAARRKGAAKHGGGFARRELHEGLLAAPEPDVDPVALDAALERLAQRDPQKAKLVELRYFAGLTGDQAAQVLGLSPSSIDREWAYIRAWLRREMDRAP